MSKQRGKNIVGGNISRVGGHVVVGDGVTIIQGDTTRAPIDYLRDLPPLPESLTYPAEPFVGLRWFTRAEARIFFGRGDKVKELHDRLSVEQGPPVTLLYGQSGVGKSSLLHAGLLPRLEAQFAVHYLRRNYDTGLPSQITAALATHAEQPRLLILDQVEEWLTHPHPERTEEAVATARLVAEHPEVRWLLSFRKEYLAELTELFRGVGVAPQFVYLEPLQYRHIVEAVEGVSRHPEARKVYGLTLETGVAAAIAHDIARDQDSHIAPALQVLMTKLWRVATGSVTDDSSLKKVLEALRSEGVEPSRSGPRITQSHYRLLVAESGLLMDEFLGEQLRLAGADFPELARHGLLIGLLHYFTTELGTARSRTPTEISRAFGHITVLPALLETLRNRYLLTDRGGEGGDNGLRLAHDALGPLVRQRFDHSAQAGPKALNILENRLLNSGSTQPAPLDNFDLATVLTGQPYMRKWTAAETELVTRSQRQRKRFLLLRNIVLVAFGALAIVIAYFGYRNYQHLIAENAQLLEDRADGLVDNPTEQLLTYHASLAPDAQDGDRLEKMYRVYRNHSFYERLLEDAEIYQAAIGVDGRTLVLLKQRGERYWAERHRFDPATRTLAWEHDLAEVLSAEQDAIAITDDGRTVVSGGADHRLHIWDEQGRARPTDTIPGNWNISLLALSPDGAQVLVGFFGRTEIQRWDLRSGRRLAQYAMNASPTALLALPEEGDFLAGFVDGTVGYYSADGMLLDTLQLDESFGGVSALSLDTQSDDRRLFVGTAQGYVHFCIMSSVLIRCNNDYAETGEIVQPLRYDPDQELLLAGSRVGRNAVIGLSGSGFRQVLAGVETPAVALAAGYDNGGVLSVHRRDGVYFWHLPQARLFDTVSFYDLERIAWAGEADPETLFFGTYGHNILTRTPSTADLVPFGGEAHQGEAITALAAGADRLVSGDVFGRVVFYDQSTGEPLARPRPVHRETVRTLLLTSDGRYALSGSADTRLVRWDARTGDTLATIWQAPFMAAALSPAEDQVAVLSPTGQLTLLTGAGWDAPGPSFSVGGIWTVAFLDEDHLLVGGDNGYGCWTTKGDSLYWIPTTAVTQIVTNRRPESAGPVAALARNPNTVWLLDARGYAYQEITIENSVLDMELKGTQLIVVTPEGLQEWEVDRLRPEVFVGSILRYPE